MTHDDALGPRRFAEILAPACRFDVPVIARWALFDIVFHGHRDELVVELRDGARTLRIGVVPSSAPHAAAHGAAGLAFHWAQPGPPDAGAAACEALAAIVRQRLGDAPRRWLADRATSAVPNDAWVSVTPARLEDDPDHALLARDARHYARLFGSAVDAVRVSADGRSHGVSLHYRAPIGARQPPKSAALYPVPACFQRRRFRHAMAALGLVQDAHGMPRTVPTPTTFARGVRASLDVVPPLSPRLIARWRGAVSARRWVRAIVDEGALLVPVAPRWAVEAYRVTCDVPVLARQTVDVGMLAHDVSLHAFALHAVAPGTWEMLRRAARLALSRSPRSAARIADVLEGTLTRAAWDTWRALEEPEDFASAFDERAPELVRVIAG